MAGAPNPADVHQDAALTDVAVAYLNDPAASIARRAFPVISVPKQSGKYYVWAAADTLRTDIQVRAPGTPAAERNWSLSKSSYYCDVLSLAFNVSRQLRSNADPAVDPEESVVKLLAQDALIKQEYDFGAVAFANNWGTYATPGTAWSSAAAYPIDDLSTAIRTVLINTGKRPNVLALGADTWYKGLSKHEDLVDRLPDTSARIVTKDFLAALMGFDEVLVSEVVYNSAVEGLSASNAFAATGDGALVFYRAPLVAPMVATAGATFVWSDLLGGGNEAEVMRYDLPKDDAFPRIELNTSYAMAVIGSALGYCFYTCVA
jgi:hypothetical protein